MFNISKISDTDRLNWLIENKALVNEIHDDFRVSINGKWMSSWKSDPRDAIDEAIKGD